MQDGMSLDDVILQVFEEHPDKFTFPLVSHKQARDFVRLLNRNGLTYEMVAEAVGEKLNYFENWRLISGEDNAIGNKVIKRLNRPLQDTILIDDEADDDGGETDKVKLLLFNGMSIDIDEDAEKSLKALDEKRHKQALEVLREAKDAEIAETEKKQKEQKAHEEIQNKKNEKAKEEAKKEADKKESLKFEEKESKKDISSKVESPKVESQPSSNISKYKVLEVKVADKTNGESLKPENKASEKGTADVSKQSASLNDAKSATSTKATSESVSAISATAAKSSSTSTTSPTSSASSNQKQEEWAKESVKYSPDSSTLGLKSNKASESESKTLKSPESKPKYPESPSPVSPALSPSPSSTGDSKSLSVKHGAIEKNDAKDAVKSAESSSPTLSSTTFSASSSAADKTVSTVTTTTSPTTSFKALPSTPVTPSSPQATSTSPTSPSSAQFISSNHPSTSSSKTVTELSISPTTIGENYDSDLDSEEVDKKSDQARVIDNVYKYKNNVLDGPGYVYILSDTSGSKPVDALSGIHRIRIGASRFPQKRFQQAQLFNPDLRLVTSKHVTKRRAALLKFEEELASMLYRNTRLWYRGGIEKILEALEGLI